MNDTTTPILEAEEIVGGRPARSVTLQEPIVRTGQTIDKLHIRKPKGSDLRGINLAEMMNANADAIMHVLPRVTEPLLVKHEIEAMDPADLLMCGMALVSFFVPKAALQ